MFGEIFSMKNILILLAIMFSMSIAMNSFKGSGNSKSSNVEEQFSTSDVKEMFKDVKNIKNDVEKLTKDLKELIEKSNPTLTNLKKKKPSPKRVKSKKEEEDVSSEEENNDKESFKNRRKAKKARRGKENFEEKFTGYNSQYGQDYLLLDD
tara:strand:- start:3058 stop:3510 length:453 start_codon:yes stop_codon:yes gene_type:complete